MQVNKVIGKDGDYGYTLSQSYYIDTILDEFNMADCQPATTVFAIGVILGSLNAAKSSFEADNMAEVPYRALIGRLSWLAQCTRPDIAFQVNVLARYSIAPGRAHWTQAKHVLRYLKHTRDVVLQYQPIEQLYGYSDSDYAADPDCRHSTNGYCFFLGGSAITWALRLQKVVASSTTEAEYYGLGDASKEAVWLRELLKELGFGDRLIADATVIFGDNQGSLALAKNPAYCQGHAVDGDRRTRFGTVLT
ncbi:protein of unknown function [Taphrina deformans PYCC 5710]|uniref:Reverse transcriptase Ty1/copia-type domain-containing protein n=1 Tax=Taphrina deformans (strain PYCC 5710 / ATCC 11124 / CBS 356.35 / IMI 108563 / JCM 9778 / NBRC 8474) TaxID=1097556 RepID=S0BE30_TAPDE|nr:protein of unknown function [Taphrina deformans PYCC 5710]|eukprot:CCG81308.1 protein of unknown function [Taphrina deformans PYCC 5710]